MQQPKDFWGYSAERPSLHTHASTLRLTVDDGLELRTRLGMSQDEEPLDKEAQTIPSPQPCNLQLLSRKRGCHQDSSVLLGLFETCSVGHRKTWPQVRKAQVAIARNTQIRISEVRYC